MTKKNLALAAVAATAFLAVLAMTAQAQQAEQPKMGGCNMMMMKGGGEGGGMDACKAMMAKHEKLMTDLKAMDQKLDDMVAAMNKESGSKKADAMAAVLTEMVKQRKAMRDAMAEMQMADETHQRQHMCMAMMASMGGCSMMGSGGAMKGCMMGSMAEMKDGTTKQ